MTNIIILTFFAIAEAYAGSVFSVTSDDEFLSDVLAKVSKSSGYKIEITKGYKNKSLTVNLKNVAIEKGLREIMRVVEEPNYALVVNDRVKKVEIRIFNDAAPGQKIGKSSHSVTRYDFRKRKQDDSELVDVSREKAEEPEEPESEPIEPPEIEIIPPE